MGHASETSGKVYKWKARLNIEGSEQAKGINCWETYAPVSTWPSIRLIMFHTLLHGWHARQMDYVQAYPQADIEVDLDMQIPTGFEIIGTTPDEFVLKLHKSSPSTIDHRRSRSVPATPHYFKTHLPRACDRNNPAAYQTSVPVVQPASQHVYNRNHHE
jgi:hypothetical protein